MFLTICCCNSSLDKFYSNTLMKDYPNANGYKYYIVIPHMGCPGCISQAEEFLLQNQNSGDFFIIITNFSSKKSLRLKYGNVLFSCNNILIDSTNKYFAFDHERNVYPMSIKLENNRIINIDHGIP